VIAIINSVIAPTGQHNPSPPILSSCSPLIASNNTAAGQQPSVQLDEAGNAPRSNRYRHRTRSNNISPPDCARQLQSAFAPFIPLFFLSSARGLSTHIPAMNPRSFCGGACRTGSTGYCCCPWGG